MKAKLLLMRLFLLITFCLFQLNCRNPSNVKFNAIQNSNQITFTLGQWSFHQDLKSGAMNNFDFIKKAAEMGFSGVEYVNQFFLDKREDHVFLDSLKFFAQSWNINSTLLLIDETDDLGASDTLIRNNAVEQHKLWILAAKRIGCPAVRVNARGDGDAADVLKHCLQSIGILAEFAQAHSLDILIENHGGYSNDANWLVQLLESLKHDNVYALPDFDNWCIERENGKLWGSPCIRSFDRYLGLTLLMPFAKAISIKAFSFNEAGEETNMNYNRLFSIIKAQHFSGNLGIEFEGESLPVEEGILKTRSLALQAWNNN